MAAIETRGATKTYRPGVGRARVREMTPPPFDRGLARLFPTWWWRGTFNALEDVTVSIEAGSSVGIVGHNGAGKTTLLKVIAGITSPTRGSVSVSGRVAALIDALVGFHPDLTGRENAFLLGAMHGFGRRAMAGRVDQVFEFAEVEGFLDTPLKRYSAGMASRLGFAVLTALDVEVMLIDEVLAVGDARFQRKCVQWLQEFRTRGGTLLFVSHNLGLVRSMTQRVLWLDHGRLVGDGATGDTLSSYARAMEQRDVRTPMHHLRAETWKSMVAEGANRWGSGGARVEEVHVEERADKGGLDVSIRFEAPTIAEAVFLVGFVDENGREVGASASPRVETGRNHGAVVCSIMPLPLRAGIYFPVVAILSPNGEVRDRWRLDRAVVVDGDGQAFSDFGPVDIAATWSQPEAPHPALGSPAE
jgi:ABC-type polysaccharide/polyol phosphate transport system ATPase subunit